MVESNLKKATSAGYLFIYLFLTVLNLSSKLGAD